MHELDWVGLSATKETHDQSEEVEVNFTDLDGSVRHWLWCAGAMLVNSLSLETDSVRPCLSAAGRIELETGYGID